MHSILKKIFFIPVFLYTYSSTGIAQEIYPPNLDYYFNFKKSIYTKKFCNAPTRIHTSVKPWVKGIQHDTCRLETKEYDPMILTRTTKKYKWLRRKFTTENFLNANTDDFKLAVNPLFNFNESRSFGNSSEKNFYPCTNQLRPIRSR